MEKSGEHEGREIQALWSEADRHRTVVSCSLEGGVSINSCWSPWTLRSSSSGRAAASGGNDSTREARSRATLTNAAATIPTILRSVSGARMSTGSMSLPCLDLSPREERHPDEGNGGDHDAKLAQVSPRPRRTV